MIITILSISCIGLLVKTTAGRDVCLKTNDGFDSRGAGFFIEVDRAVHHPVVSDCQRAKLQVYSALHQPIQSACAIKEGELRVQMQMYKFRAQQSDFTASAQGCQGEVVGALLMIQFLYVMLAFERAVDQDKEPNRR